MAQLGHFVKLLKSTKFFGLGLGLTENLKNFMTFLVNSYPLYLGWIPGSFFFPAYIFRSPNRLFDSVGGTESHAIKNFGQCRFFYFEWIYAIATQNNPRKITFLISFWIKLFSPFISVQRVRRQNMWNFLAHLLTDVASWPPTQTSTRKLKNEFSGRISQGIGPNSAYFWMILKALQIQQFKIKIHSSV